MVQRASEGFRYGETNPAHVKAVAKFNIIMELNGWEIIQDEDAREFHFMYRFRAVNPWAKQKTHLCDSIAHKVHGGPFSGNLETWIIFEADGEIHEKDSQQWRDKKFKKALTFAAYEIFELTDVRLVRIDKYEILETEDPDELYRKFTDKKFAL